MIARNPKERQLYDDRLKAERDEWARTEQAKREGELVGKIELLCQLLNQPYAGNHPLRDMTIGELSEIEAGLQQRLRDRT